MKKTSPKDLCSCLQSSSEYDSLSSSSSSSVVDSRSDASVDSSLSDPIAHCSINQSSDEELDFNIGFEQMSDDEHIFNRTNSDAGTLLGEPVVDAYFRRLSNADYDDAVAEYFTKQGRASFLHDSTHTLCSQSRFAVFTDDDEEEDEQPNAFPIRSNSFSALPMDNTSTFVERTPKKAVRFADMMGLDLESIRYMTPPDETASSFIQECVRLHLGKLHPVKNLSDTPSTYKRTSSFLSSPNNKYNLVSKNFTSPINITPLIYNQQVLLECLYTKDASAQGTIRVHNCTYNKSVFVRLSHDEWQTFGDIPASHSMSYPHDNTDTFGFQVALPKSNDENRRCKRILFAVCFQAMEQEFWDNNRGWNYVLDVVERR